MEKFKKKDFWPMLVHHLITILLITICHVFLYHRIGVICLLVHDLNDIILEGSKMIKYSKLENLALIGFVVFILSWIITRFILFPLRVVYPFM